MALIKEQQGLKVKLIITELFRKKFLGKGSASEDLLKENIKRLLEGKFRKGETFLPKKDLGKNLIFLKGRIEEKKPRIADRFLVLIHTDNIYVVPVFLAKKTSNLGRNIHKDDPIYYQIAKDQLNWIKDGEKVTLEDIQLSIPTISFPGGLTIPRK